MTVEFDPLKSVTDDYGQPQGRKDLLRFGGLQNQQNYLERLAATRQLQVEEKKILSIWTIITVTAAVFGAGTITAVQAMLPYVTLISFAVFIVEFPVLHFARKKRKLAAKIQEGFDCELLEIKWNEDVAGTKPQRQEIGDVIKRFKKKAKEGDWQRLENWFSPELANELSHIARASCQREKIERDKDVRLFYVKVVLSAIALFLMTFTMSAMLLNWTVIKFITVLLPPVLLVLTLVFKHIYDNTKVACKLGELYVQSELLWKNACASDVDSEELIKESRELQDEIFRYRLDNPPVIEWVYNILSKT